MKEAQEQELDLVQIAIKDGIPICKYLDYNKYVYGLKKKKRETSNKKQELKEIKITANTEEHDIKIK
ncbi:translation initiation factor IF-3, partial [human gut metagenome]